jgi:hypothetical protein
MDDLHRVPTPRRGSKLLSAFERHDRDKTKIGGSHRARRGTDH